MSTFDSTKTQHSKLLEEIAEGKIQLPDFQRGWVWDNEHIRSLLVLVSAARGKTLAPFAEAVPEVAVAG